jgi:hypothetical protein
MFESLSVDTPSAVPSLAPVTTTAQQPLPLPRFGLAAKAEASLVMLFAEVGHQPSPEQWAAIRDLLELWSEPQRAT